MTRVSNRIIWSHLWFKFCCWDLSIIFIIQFTWLLGVLKAWKLKSTSSSSYFALIQVYRDITFIFCHRFNCRVINYQGQVERPRTLIVKSISSGLNKHNCSIGMALLIPHFVLQSMANKNPIVKKEVHKTWKDTVWILLWCR